MRRDHKEARRKADLRVKANMISRHIALVLGSCLLLNSASEAEAQSPTTPFEKYLRVADRVYVYDKSHFVPYSGPPVPPLATDNNDAIGRRLRLGTIVVAPGTRLNLDFIEQPISIAYELRDPSTGSLVHAFSYDHVTQPTPILFSGRGAIYDYATVPPLCSGPVTRKFEFISGSVSEVRQPLLLLNAEAEVLQNVELLSADDDTGSVVASLPKGAKIVVITFRQPNRFLIKTPLGLTGWLIDRLPGGSLSITQCN